MSSPRLKFLRFAGLFAVVHLLISVASLLTSFGLGMSRFDDSKAPVATPLELVSSNVAGILLQPAESVYSLAPPGSLSSSVQWLVLAANSALWGLLLAAVFWRLTRRSTGRADS